MNYAMKPYDPTGPQVDRLTLEADGQFEIWEPRQAGMDDDGLGNTAQAEIQSLMEHEPTDVLTDATHEDNLHAAIMREEALREEAELAAKAIEMGVPGNLTLAKYIRELERELGMMHCYIDERLRKIEAGDDWRR